MALIEATARTSDRRRLQIPEAPPINSAYLFENIINDLHSTACSIAIVTCLFSARAKGISTSLKSWRTILMDDLPVITLALRYAPAAELSDEQTAAIRELYESFADIKKGSGSLFDYNDELTSQQLQDYVEHAVHWQKLSTSAASALTAVEGSTKKRLNSHYYENAHTIVDFAREAARGSTARMNALGEIEIPVLSQRRSHPRATINIACRIFAAGRIYSANLRDASTHGIGLDCQEYIAGNERASVELSSGRKLQGRIVWSENGRLGMTLDNPLSRDDSLLLECRP